MTIYSLDILYIWNQSVVPCSILTNCCFLTCIQVSQEAGHVVRYSHLCKNFPESIVIHTAKGFGIINKAKVDVFLEYSCFFSDPADPRLFLDLMSATVFSKLSGRFAPYRLTLFGLISYSGSPCPAPPESSPLLSKFLQGHVGWSYSRFEISFFSSLSRACTSAVKCYCDWTLANAWQASRAAPC